MIANEVESPILDDVDSKNQILPEATPKSHKISQDLSVLERHPQSLGPPQKNHHLRPTSVEKAAETLPSFSLQPKCQVCLRNTW